MEGEGLYFNECALTAVRESDTAYAVTLRYSYNGQFGFTRENRLLLINGNWVWETHIDPMNVTLTKG